MNQRHFLVYLMRTSVMIMAIYDGRLLGILLDSIGPNLTSRRFHYLQPSLVHMLCYFLVVRLYSLPLNVRCVELGNSGDPHDDDEMHVSLFLFLYQKIKKLEELNCRCLEFYESTQDIRDVSML